MLIDSIQNNFNFLFEDYGFTASEDETENTDWIVVLTFGFLRFRFIEDRANLFMDIALISEPNEWHELVSVLSLINKKQGLDDSVRIKNNVGNLRSLLTKYLDILIRYADDEDFRRSISKLKSV